MACEPGTQVATLLLNCGLGFDAVIQGLVVEIGMSTAQATRVTAAAVAKRGTPIAALRP
jgi:hypothetical protein